MSDDDAPLLPHLIVFEPEDPPRTGLVDADGNPLVRRRNPIGFDLTRKGDQRHI